MSYLTIDNYKKYLVKHTKRKLTFEMFGITYIIDQWKRCWLLNGRTSKYGYKTYGYDLSAVPEGFEIFRNKYDQEAFIKHFIRGKDDKGYLYRLTTEDLVRVRRMKISYFDDNKLNDADTKERKIIRTIRRGRKKLKDFSSLPNLHVGYNNPTEILNPLPKYVTLERVNVELKNLGYDEVLVKGNGYLYFEGGTASLWETTVVEGVKRLNHLTIEQWVEKRNLLSSKVKINEKLQTSTPGGADPNQSS